MKNIGINLRRHEERMKQLNSREQNFFNSLILEALFKKKEVIIQEIEQINAEKKKGSNPRLSHLREERHLVNSIISKLLIL